MNSVSNQTKTAAQDGAAVTAVKTDSNWVTRLGWWIVIAGVGGFFFWASTAPLDKGVPLTGTVIVSTKQKAIQHLTGGTVEAILVKEGDVVKAGDTLVRMNNVQATANAEMSRGHYLIARSTEARWVAERDEQKVIAFPPALQSARSDPRVVGNLALQQQLLASRQAAIRSELEGIEENIIGLTLQYQGLEESLGGKRQRLKFMKEQLVGVRDLAKEGYVARNRLLDLEQAHAQAEAAIAEDMGNIGRIRQQVAELKLRILQRRQEYRKEVHAQLSEVQKEADSLANRLKGLDYDLANSRVIAPADGTIVGVNVFTEGGIVGPGFLLMSIVPSGDELVVEGQVPVHLIDKVLVGLPIELIFSALNQNLTPRVPAVATQVSADRFIEEKSGAPYYKLRAQVSAEGMKMIAGLQIRPGMSVDMFVKTGERTMMNYLLRPIYDHLKMSLTEQ